MAETGRSRIALGCLAGIGIAILAAALFWITDRTLVKSEHLQISGTGTVITEIYDPNLPGSEFEYEVTFVSDRDEQHFFSGAGFRHFEVVEAEGRAQVQYCGGTVERVVPFTIHRMTETDLEMGADLVWFCPEERE